MAWSDHNTRDTVQKKTHWTDALPTRVRNALNVMVYDSSNGARCITDLDEATAARMAAERDPAFWRALPNFGKHSQRGLQQWLASKELLS
jgi:hypothetical protein